MTHFVSKFASGCGVAAVAVLLAAAPVAAQPGWGGWAVCAAWAQVVWARA